MLDTHTHGENLRTRNLNIGREDMDAYLNTQTVNNGFLEHCALVSNDMLCFVLCEFANFSNSHPAFPSCCI